MRIVFVILAILATIAFLLFTLEYFRPRVEDAYMATAIFLFLPGILVASTLASEAMAVIMLVSLYLYAHIRGKLWLEIVVMVGFLFIHLASAIFFTALLIYALVNKQKQTILISTIFLAFSLVFEKFIVIGGRPSGYLVELFGVYAALFSPFVFLYVVFAFYRILIRQDKKLIWYISFIPFVASLLLSIRQRISLMDFAPYVMMAIIPALEIYYRSLRVRLPEHQGFHKKGFVVVLSMLFIASASIVLSRPLFEVLSDPNKHFAYRIYGPYWKAQELKADNKSCFDSNSLKESCQMRYYGIVPCNKER
ncbi:MAG TPA: hypothetical protein ENN12_04630 [Epsilonproteobacteria bacterium]|nr:hypothetical protein [Campylobacterota bacterium]